MANKHIDNIVKLLTKMGEHTGPQSAFRDFCEMFALALYNGCTLHNKAWQERENRYLALVKQYNAKAIPEITAELTFAFEEEPFIDHLGNIYMQTYTGNKQLGQCFTPTSVCKLMAEVVLSDPPKNGEQHTLMGPCCGGGALIIAFLEQCKLTGYNYQKYLKIYASDLDSLCVHMTYIQLSLLGARAIVKHENSITMQEYGHFITPMEMLRLDYFLTDNIVKQEPSPTQNLPQPEKGQLLLL